VFPSSLVRVDVTSTAGKASGTQASAGAQNQPRPPRSDSAVVWELHADNTMEPVKVSLGITDHSYTEVRAVARGELKGGDELITRSVVAKSTAPGSQALGQSAFEANSVSAEKHGQPLVSQDSLFLTPFWK